MKNAIKEFKKNTEKKKQKQKFFPIDFDWLMKEKLQ